MAKGQIVNIECVAGNSNFGFGSDQVLVRIGSILCHKYVIGSRLSPGSCLPWNKDALLPLASEPVGEVGSLADESDDDHGSGQNVKKLKDIIIQRCDWKELTVKVVDEEKVVFAIAMVSTINPEVALQGTLLGETHVGILIMEFVDGARRDHLR